VTLLTWLQPAINHYDAPAPYGAIHYIIIIIIIIFLAHQHKACRQLKIKQEMTAVGD